MAQHTDMPVAMRRRFLQLSVFLGGLAQFLRRSDATTAATPIPPPPKNPPAKIIIRSPPAAAEPLSLP